MDRVGAGTVERTAHLGVVDCQIGGVDVVGHPIIDGCDLLDLSQRLTLDLELISELALDLLC